MNKKVVTFGELLLRLSPFGYKRIVQAESFEAIYAGAEANVAVSLAVMDVPSAVVSKVPAHEIGQCAVNTLRKWGVDTSNIARGGDRLGIYFIEKGASQQVKLQRLLQRLHKLLQKTQPELFSCIQMVKV